jgi:uncharacterized coiled-coil DUF342 family protein
MTPNETIWQYIAITAVALLVGIVGWFARNTREELKELKKEHDVFKDDVLKNFHSKDEMKEILGNVRDALNEVKDSVKEVHRRLDSVLANMRPGG